MKGWDWELEGIIWSVADEWEQWRWHIGGLSKGEVSEADDVVFVKTGNACFCFHIFLQKIKVKSKEKIVFLKRGYDKEERRMVF